MEQITREEMIAAIDDLVDWAYRQICPHEETHRGGAIWEICSSCGAKWADDEGGKPEFKLPEEVANAERVSAALQAAEPAMVVDIRRDLRDGSPSPRILKFTDLGDGEHQLFTLPCPPAKVSHWSLENPGRADQYRAEALAVRRALGFREDADDVAPADLEDAINALRQPAKAPIPIGDFIEEMSSDPEFVKGLEEGRQWIKDQNLTWCDCGDGYPANSYGAAFIDIFGHCENCHMGSETVDPAAQVESWAGGFRINPMGNIERLRDGMFLYSCPNLPYEAQGWKLVPIEPTPDMTLQGALAGVEHGNGEFSQMGAKAVYKAMLTASPAPAHIPDTGEMIDDHIGDGNEMVSALRQYRHNDDSGFVFAYDKEQTDRIVTGLVEALEQIAESCDVGRYDGKPEDGPMLTDMEMWLIAQEALNTYLQQEETER